MARNLAQFRTAYGPAAPAVGNYVNQLGPDGGAIELYRSGPPSPETRVDRVAFRASAPWPAAANGAGASLQLLDPRQDNARVANWAAVVGQSTNAPRTVVPIDATWRYWQAAENPASGWTNRVYDDSKWPTGKALLYAEDAPLPAPKNTPLTIGVMSYLFRTTFQFNGNPTGASLQLSPVVDDGAVFYLNGQAVYWLGMTQGEIPERNTPATRTTTDAIFEGPFVIPVDSLRIGENVLAVEVHQTNPGSSDVVMGVTADIIEVRRESFTPGYANSVTATLEPFPNIGLNELLAVNNTGLTDNAGDRDPWIELANYGPTPVGLDGWYLSSSYSNLARWPFPTGAALAGGQFRLIWADAEPAENTTAAWHTNFRLAATSGVVVLSRLQNGEPAVVDFLEYAGLPADNSFGFPAPRLVDSTPSVLANPTPGAANGLPPAPAPVITALQIGVDHEVTLRWTATAGRTYRVEAKAALDDTTWTVLGTVTATGAEALFTDTKTTDQAIRFYRVALLP